MRAIVLRDSSPETAGTWPAVETLSVTDLFGRYTYRKLQLGTFGSSDSGIALLYGGNGSGKTTLLRLLYACLSPEVNQGLRTYIASTPFREFAVDLRDGTALLLRKTSGLIGSYDFIIKGPRASGKFSVRADDAGAIKASANPDLEPLKIELKKIGLDLLFLHDTRRIQSTFRVIHPPNSWTTTHYWQVLQAQRVKEFDVDVFHPPEERENTSLPVKAVVASAYDWIRRRATREGSTGELDASLVYLQVIKTLSQIGPSKVEASPLKENLVASLAKLKEETAAYIGHGLLSDYPFDSLIEVLNSAPAGRIPEISNVLTPYVNSIRTRVQALEGIRKIVSVFESEINGYLRDKHVTVNVLEGIRFSDGVHELDVESLSSGERQLVFLFCAALLSRVGSSLFIIDEPELSLNPTWQRKLVSSLSNLARGGQTQFIMATHSIEILSKHRSSVVELLPRATASQDH